MLLALLSDYVGGQKRGILIALAAASTALIVTFTLLCDARQASYEMEPYNLYFRKCMYCMGSPTGPCYMTDLRPVSARRRGGQRQRRVDGRAQLGALRGAHRAHALPVCLERIRPSV